MPDLAGAPGRPDQRLPVDDQAAADADLTRDVHEVVHADARTPGVLRQGTKIGLVRDGHGEARAEAVVDQAAERDIAPSEVRREMDESVRATNDPRNSDAESGDPAARRDRRLRGLDELADVFDGLVSGQTPGLVGHPAPMQDPAAEADDCRRQRVDGDLRSDHRGAFRDSGGRPATAVRARRDAPDRPPQPARAREDPRSAPRWCSASYRVSRRSPSATAPPTDATGGARGSGCGGGRIPARPSGSSQRAHQVAASARHRGGSRVHLIGDANDHEARDTIVAGQARGCAPRRERTSMTPAARRTSATTMSIQSEVTPMRKRPL